MKEITFITMCAFERSEKGMKFYMIKKLVAVITIMLLSLSVFISLVYAENVADSVVKLEETEISINDNIIISFYLNKIEYSNYIIQITSSKLINNVEIENDILNNNSENKNEDTSLENNESLNDIRNDDSYNYDSENINIESDDYTTEILINKNDLNLDVLTLNYTINDDLNIGDKVNFDIVIINAENDDEKMNYTLTATIVDSATNTSEENTLNENTQVSNEFAGNFEDMSSENIDDKNQNNNAQSVDVQSNENNSSNTRTVQSSPGNSSNSMSSISTQSKETVTYNGSSNNYLSSLNVEGYDFTSEFQKENLTYFINVDSDTEAVNINAETEDSSANVYIYGKDNLSEGINKILVTVCAENGNSRTYRIYVTKN